MEIPPEILDSFGFGRLTANDIYGLLGTLSPP